MTTEQRKQRPKSRGSVIADMLLIQDEALKMSVGDSIDAEIARAYEEAIGAVNSVSPIMPPTTSIWRKEAIDAIRAAARHAAGKA